VAGVCTNSTRINGAGCDHRQVVVALDGQAINLETTEAKLDADPWGDEQKRQFILLGLKRLRTLGLSLDAAVGRVTNGEEATNVKQYTLLGKDVTKTNIGTAYVNVPPGANGERTLVEFTGCTEFKVMVHAVLNGTGQHQMRIVRDSDNAVLYESALIAAQAGEREFETAIIPLPAEAVGLIYVRFQAKSATAADDPIFRRCVLMVR
jgi:hypothetical protein